MFAHDIALAAPNLDALIEMALTSVQGNTMCQHGLLECALANPSSAELKLVAPARFLGLGNAEIFCLWLLYRNETDARIAGQLAALQQGEARHRPTIALFDLLLEKLGCAKLNLTSSLLFSLPLARFLPGPAPLPISAIALTEPMLAALNLPGGPALSPQPMPIHIPASWQTIAAELVARILGNWQCHHKLALILRSGLPADQLLFAQAIAQALAKPLIVLGSDVGRQGFSPAFHFTGAIAYEALQTAPGVRSQILPLNHGSDIRLIGMGKDGGVDAIGWECVDVNIPKLTADDRRALWPQARDYPTIGLGPARLKAIATRMGLADPSNTELDIFRAAAGEETRTDIEPHGRLVFKHVLSSDLVASPQFRSELDLLEARCRQRHLPPVGINKTSHHGDRDIGVRALLSGPSGSGKTLACAWLATRLGLPLFRIDLSSVVSKYIGETEENLSRILDRAEASDVILLFDEADSLFGARTEIRDSSDRFANNQTNYLLTRIESYDGIVLLTCNGRSQIDPAFARRIEHIIDVPVPDAQTRRSIWLQLLGENHSLVGADISRLATSADIAGGHIKSVVNTANVLASQANAPICLADIQRGLMLEYRKIGRTMPSLLGAS